MNASIDRTEWFSDQQLQKLAEDKKNRVFKFTHDAPGKVLSADEARDLIRDIRARFLTLRQQNSDWDDDKIRHHICSEKYRWKQFASQQSLNFTHATNRETDDAKMEHIYYMLYVKKQTEVGQITQEQARAMVRDYMLKESMKKKPPSTRRK